VNNSTNAYIDAPSTAFKMSIKIFLRTVVAGLLCFIIYLSLYMAFMILGTENIGYKIYEVDNSGNTVLVDEISFDSKNPNADSLKLEENQRMEYIRSDLSKKIFGTLSVLQQVSMFAVFISMIYPIMWEYGNKDRARIQGGRMREDQIKGLKVGLLAAIPSTLSIVPLALFKVGLISFEYPILYGFLNIPFRPYVDLVWGNIPTAVSLSWLSIFATLLIPIVIILTCFLWYWLGYKEIIPKHIFMYKHTDK